MPHECTSCGRVFQDGSKEMLSGCPECGGNKFQYRPRSRSNDDANARSSSAGDGSSEGGDSRGRGGPDGSPGGSTTDGAPSGTGGAPGPEDAPSTGRGAVTDAGRGARAGASEPEPARAAGEDDSVVERRSRDPDGEGDRDGGGDTGARGGPDDDGPEDRAQADARTGVVTPEELDAAASSRERARDAATEGAGEGDEDRPSIDQLRQELNDQFESIRIVSPGKYELNLMELYNREEYVISLQEDGRYVIEVPESWRRPPDDG